MLLLYSKDSTLSMCHFSLKFLHCVFSNGLLQRMHTHTGCICFTFLHCVFSNVFSDCLPERMQSHIGCICLTFLHCGAHNVFSNVSSNCLPEKRHSHIGYITLQLHHNLQISELSNNICSLYHVISFKRKVKLCFIFPASTSS